MPALSTQQAQEALPRRLTNPRAEVVALSTGMEDVVLDVVDDANIGDDEYAQGRLLRALEAFAKHWEDGLGSRGYVVNFVILGRNTHPTPNSNTS